MAERREKLDIIRDILQAIQDKGKIKPTHLLYKSNLSHSSMKKYVGELTDRGMVFESEQGKQKVFVLTEKGLKFLENYRQIKEFTDSFGL